MHTSKLLTSLATLLIKTQKKLFLDTTTAAVIKSTFLNEFQTIFSLDSLLHLKSIFSCSHMRQNHRLVPLVQLFSVGPLQSNSKKKRRLLCLKIEECSNNILLSPEI